jgi:hypothetical protein
MPKALESRSLTGMYISNGWRRLRSKLFVRTACSRASQEFQPSAIHSLARLILAKCTQQSRHMDHEIYHRQQFLSASQFDGRYEDYGDLDH